MTINQQNSVKYTFSVPNWSEMCRLVDVLTAPLLLPNREMSIFSAGEIAWMWCQELNIYIYYPLDNGYGFLSIGNTKIHVATLTCLEWQLKFVNISIMLAPKLTSHACALLIDNVGNYLFLNNGRFKFEVDPHQFNISSTLDCTTFHSFNVKKKKDFQKLAGLWLAGKMVDHIGI